MILLKATKDSEAGSCPKLLAEMGEYHEEDDGKQRSFVDGPFAETKECLAGFYLIEARDLNEAIQVARQDPPASVGSIEVRPIRPIREGAVR
jgi:hypothetical protein